MNTRQLCARVMGAGCVVVAAVAVVAGCSQPVGTSVPSSAVPAHSDCEILLAEIVAGVRTDNTSDAFNEKVGALSSGCPEQMDIATDYFALTAETGSAYGDVCESIRRGSLHTRAVELIREDGHCADTSEGLSGLRGAELPSGPWPNGGLGWNEAGALIGTEQRVCGPLQSVRDTEWGVFVNVGRDYPSLERFTFVLWGDWWLDPITPAATVCATGTLSSYEGVTQMEIADPSQLEIWN